MPHDAATTCPWLPKNGITGLRGTYAFFSGSLFRLCTSNALLLALGELSVP